MTMKLSPQQVTRVLGGLIVSLIIASSAGAQSTITITDLGTLDGVGNSSANAVNDAGQVVGWSHRSDGMTHATLWTSVPLLGWTATDLGTLCSGSCDDSSVAYDINGNGQVVGISYTSFLSTRAFLWENGSMTELPPLPGDSYAAAHGINNQGQIVGQSSGASGNPRAVLWTNGTPQDLGVLGYLPGNPIATSSAFGINDAGQVVGWSETSSNDVHAFLWTSGSGMTDLGGGGSCQYQDDSVAYGINASGDAAGGAFFANCDQHAATWVNGAINHLGTLAGPTGGYSLATGINDAGDVSGFSPNGCTSRATLWTKGSIVDLGSLVPGPCGRSGANGINNNGQIAGSSPIPAGESHAVLFSTEPAPPTIEALIAQVAGLPLPSRAKRALSATLATVDSAIERGNTRAARIFLRVFILEVRSLEGRGLLPHSIANELVANAEAIANGL